MKNITIDENSSLLIRLRGSNKGECGSEMPVEQVELYPPTTYQAKKIAAFFDGDKDVFTHFNFNKSLLTVYVKGIEKAEAVGFLLKRKFEFGGLTLDVKVVQVIDGGPMEEVPTPTYTITTAALLKYIETMMKGNKFEGDALTYTDPLYQKTYYFYEFAPVVCSYGVDDISNPHGFQSALAVDVFKDIFDVESNILLSTRPN